MPDHSATDMPDSQATGEAGTTVIELCSGRREGSCPRAVARAAEARVAPRQRRGSRGILAKRSAAWADAVGGEAAARAYRAQSLARGAAGATVEARRGAG